MRIVSAPIVAFFRLRTRLLPRAIVQCLATFLTMWLAFVWLGARVHLLYIWPLTAVQLSIALSSWREPRSRLAQLGACTLGELIATLLLGMPLWIGATMSAVQTAEVACAASLLAPQVVGFDDLKSSTNVLRFLLTSLLVPLAAIVLVAKPISIVTHQPPFHVWLLVAPSDVLGYVILLPPILFLISGEYRSLRKLRPHLRAGLSALFLLTIATGLIFFEHTTPFLFMLFPFMMIALFVLGLEGGVFGTLIVALLACLATSREQGPVWLMPRVTPERSALFLQIFLATVVAVALPVGSLLDERRRAERTVREGQSIYGTLIENADDMIILSSLDGDRRFVSPAVAKVTGWTSEEYLSLGQLGAMHPKDRDHAQNILESLAEGKMHHTLRYRILCKDQSYRWVEATVRGYSHDGLASGYVATVRDISTQVESEAAWVAERAALARENEQLTELASRDELTGLANRRTFNRTLEFEAARHSRSPRSLSLMMIDVDHFKRYNDLYGHQAGDDCLRRIAQALQSGAGRISDLVARIGGEEFAVLLPETDEAGARKLAEDMLRKVSDLCLDHPESSHGRVSISIGIAFWRPYYTTEVAQLIQQADRALYESKRSGRNWISVSGETSAV